ncbi:Predicted gene 29394 [Apodemus speciosus]|uniref:Predicted gene 29394 n=1 Tax=Apodemus speciosus TaxID=105296 RepID=A0ABQ0FJF4_APOSI
MTQSLCQDPVIIGKENEEIQCKIKWGGEYCRWFKIGTYQVNRLPSDPDFSRYSGEKYSSQLLTQRSQNLCWEVQLHARAMETGCWVLGGEFEDSVFEQRPERRPESPSPYGAKLCEPQWFYEETESSDDIEVLTLKKFRGDLAYRRQEYEKALQEYSSISEQLPSTNFAMKRDVREGQARCLAHLGRHEEALEVAADLESKATNTDHLTTVLCLHLAVFASLQSWEKTVLCLQKLISLHPLNPWSWCKLAEAYLNPGPDLPALGVSPQGQKSSVSSDKAVSPSFVHAGTGSLLSFPAPLPENALFSVEASGRNTQKAPKNMQNGLGRRREEAQMEARRKACASLIRARLLLQLAQPQQTSFALEKNLRTQQEISGKVKELNFSEDTLLLMEEAMGEDLVPEKIKEELHSEVKCMDPAALAASVVSSSKEFEDKWFRKIKDHFHPLGNQSQVEIQIMT